MSHMRRQAGEATENENACQHGNGGVYPGVGPSICGYPMSLK